MDKEDLLLIFLVVFLLIAILVTFFFGGNQSRHGYGQNVPMSADGIVLDSVMHARPRKLHPATWAHPAFERLRGDGVSRSLQSAQVLRL